MVTPIPYRRKLDRRADTMCTKSMTYNSSNKYSKDVDRITSNTAFISCSDNIAYSMVSSGNTAPNDYLVPRSGNINYPAAMRVAGQKEEKCEADVYEEVQTTSTTTS